MNEKINELYLAYYTQNKNVVCWFHDKSKVESYLFKNDIYDECTIFKSTSEKFNKAIRSEYWSYRLTVRDTIIGTFICTDKEWGYIHKQSYENYKRTTSILNDFSYLINTVDFTEKELEKIIKASKVLSKINREYEVDRLVPKQCLDNKTIRKLVQMDDEIYGRTENDDFESFYKRYEIILI